MWPLACGSTCGIAWRCPLARSLRDHCAIIAGSFHCDALARYRSLAVPRSVRITAPTASPRPSPEQHRIRTTPWRSPLGHPDALIGSPGRQVPTAVYAIIRSFAQLPVRVQSPVRLRNRPLVYAITRSFARPPSPEPPRPEPPSRKPDTRPSRAQSPPSHDQRAQYRRSNALHQATPCANAPTARALTRPRRRGRTRLQAPRAQRPRDNTPQAKRPRSQRPQTQWPRLQRTQAQRPQAQRTQAQRTQVYRAGVRHPRAIAPQRRTRAIAPQRRTRATAPQRWTRATAPCAMPACASASFPRSLASPASTSPACAPGRRSPLPRAALILYAPRQFRRTSSHPPCGRTPPKVPPPFRQYLRLPTGS